MFQIVVPWFSFFIDSICWRPLLEIIHIQLDIMLRTHSIFLIVIRFIFNVFISWCGLRWYFLFSLMTLIERCCRFLWKATEAWFLLLPVIIRFAFFNRIYFGIGRDFTWTWIQFLFWKIAIPFLHPLGTSTMFLLFDFESFLFIHLMLHFILWIL